MSDRVYQILYCSRNHIRGTAEQIGAEVASILETSQRNNARVGVTGALFHNGVFFAQVLEGKFIEVQRVFERLQLDARHSDLVVLQSGYVNQRDFAGWSMTYAGASPKSVAPFEASDNRETVGAGSSLSGQKVLAFLREVVLKQEGWALPERHSAIRPMNMAR